MKFYQRLFLSGVWMLIVAMAVAACSGATATPVVIVVTATPEDTAAPTEPFVPVLEVVGLSAAKTLTIADLKALPVREGYAGIKSSTGKITPPITFKGIPLRDLAEYIGGMDDTSGFNVVAEDGYGITFSFDQIENGAFVAYDPATGSELKTPWN